MFDVQTATEASKRATEASLRSRALGKAVIDAAIAWNGYLRTNPSQLTWKSIYQIRLSEAVEAYNEFKDNG